MIKYALIFIFYGLLGITAQLVIFRELLALFYGSELFLGTFLSSWLFWTGLGSLSAKRLLKDGKLSERYFSYSFLALSVILPLEILLIRLSKNIFSFGEFIGPVAMVFYTFAVMSFLCFSLGAQFSAGCLIASNNAKFESALGKVYLFETLGFVIGGVVFTYLLIGYVPTFVIALLLSLGCVTVSFCTVDRKVSGRSMVLIAAVLFVLCVNFSIEPLVNKFQWKRYEFIKQKETRNATLSLVEMGSIKNVFSDGVIQASFPNPESYESVAHWPLLATPVVGRILVLGDWSLGALKEVLKHSPASIDYVVLDNSFIELVKPYLAKEDILALTDKRVNIRYGDMRLFIAKQKSKYDAVIINIQEVTNLKVNRFFTREFYLYVKSILEPNGILAVTAASSENYLSIQTRMFNASVYKTLKAVFENNIEIVPADNITFFCGLAKIDMSLDTILARFNKRKISNKYFIPSYIEHKLDVNRRVELKRILEETFVAQINMDFKPVAYYYFANFWLNKFTSPLEYFFGFSLLVIMVVLILRKRGSLADFIRQKELVVIFTIGFCGILLEMILLLGFQILSGYVYWQMGILFASFMLGAFLGAYMGNHCKQLSMQRKRLFLMGACFLIIILSVCMRYLLLYFTYTHVWQNLIIVFALLVFIGVITGASFVIAGLLITEENIMLKAGSLYAADLWGAALAAFLSTNFVIPMLGIIGALNFCAIIGIVGLSVFLKGMKRI